MSEQVDRIVEPIEYMLTTVDNPYNPFTYFNEWYAWDESHEYHTSGLLARTIISSYELSEADQLLDIQVAIDEILEHNIFGVHRKVSRDSFVDDTNVLVVK